MAPWGGRYLRTPADQGVRAFEAVQCGAIDGLSIPAGGERSGQSSPESVDDPAFPGFLREPRNREGGQWSRRSLARLPVVVGE